MPSGGRPVRTSAISAGEARALRLLAGSEYFSRLARRQVEAGFLAALAISLLLLFLTVAPAEALRPLVITFGEFWIRYSVLGDLLLFTAIVRYYPVAGPGARIFLVVCGCIAVLHSLTSWHDPWGILFSNALVEWLVLSCVAALLLSQWHGTRGRLELALAGAGLFVLLATGALVVLADFSGALALSARRPLVRLLGFIGSAELAVWVRGGYALAAVLFAGLALRLRVRQPEDARELARVRRAALLD